MYHACLYEISNPDSSLNRNGKRDIDRDNLKDQYEEQRRVETEKIKRKYSKRNSVLMN